MQFHYRPREKKGFGGWEALTGRYIPMCGGSYSRLSIIDDANIRRYWGFVGIDESLTAEISDIPSLYKHMSGGVYIPEGPAGAYIQKLIELSFKWVNK